MTVYDFLKLTIDYLVSNKKMNSEIYLIIIKTTKKILPSSGTVHNVDKLRRILQIFIKDLTG